MRFARSASSGTYPALKTVQGAFRMASPWAGFLAYIGHPAVLSSPRLSVSGQMYVTNLINRPMFIVNGGTDRLYPTSSVAPFIAMFEEFCLPRHDARRNFQQGFVADFAIRHNLNFRTGREYDDISFVHLAAADG